MIQTEAMEADKLDLSYKIYNSFNNLVSLLTNEKFLAQDNIHCKIGDENLRVINLDLFEKMLNNTVNYHIQNLYIFAYSGDLIQEGKEAISFFEKIESILDSGSVNVRFTNVLSRAKARIKMNENDAIDVATLSIIADVTTMGIIQAIKRNNLKAEKIGNMWTIKTDEATNWLHSRKNSRLE
jgi:hypothetical protein